jgi:hypothetical protein
MTAITRASFDLIWTTTYSSLLGPGRGRLTTQKGYTSVFTARPGGLLLPWEDRHWSFFWSYYLGGPKRLRDLSANGAWERLVPFRTPEVLSIGAPAGAAATATVLVYPTAISVVIKVDVTGNWAVSELADALSALRRRRDFALTMLAGASTDRTLDGIAAAIRDEAATFLAEGSLTEPGTTIATSAAAPLAAIGEDAPLALTEADAKACLAGLASLGPPGALQDASLFKENTNTNLSGRVYAPKDGHALWHPVGMFKQLPADPIDCLLSNQTALVAHISALSALVSWAGDRAKRRIQIPAEPLVLAKLAAFRLDQLHTGDKTRTYRSELAKVRIDPLLVDIATVQRL